MKKQKWTEEDKRNFHDQNIRANTIPGRRDSGPLSQEWESDGSDYEDSDPKGDGPSH
jgi:hypothetical protein